MTLKSLYTSLTIFSFHTFWASIVVSYIIEELLQLLGWAWCSKFNVSCMIWILPTGRERREFTKYTNYRTTLNSTPPPPPPTFFLFSSSLYNIKRSQYHLIRVHASHYVIVIHHPRLWNMLGIGRAFRVI